VVANLARDGRLDLSGLDEGVYRRLSAELRARRYRIQSDRTLRVESKDEIRKRIGRSPDDADALVLAFAPCGTWEVLDVGDLKPEPVAPARTPAARAQQEASNYTRQITDAIAVRFPEPEEGRCGQCAHLGERPDGQTVCQLRQLLVERRDVGCDAFDLNA